MKSIEEMLEEYYRTYRSAFHEDIRRTFTFTPQGEGVISVNNHGFGNNPHYLSRRALRTEIRRINHFRQAKRVRNMLYLAQYDMD